MSLMSVQLRRDFATADADAAHCLIMCAPAPSPSIAPVHGLLETAARGKQRVMVVCHRPIVPRSSHAVAKGKQRTQTHVNLQKSTNG